MLRLLLLPILGSISLSTFAAKSIEELTPMQRFLLPKPYKVIALKDIPLAQSYITPFQRWLKKDARETGQIGLSQFLLDWDSLISGTAEDKKFATEKYNKLVESIRSKIIGETKIGDIVEIMRNTVIEEGGYSEYCSNESGMNFVLQLQSNCGNCMGSTKLYAALVDDLNLREKLKEKATFGLRVYTNHIEPVVIAGEELVNMVSGDVEPLKDNTANIYSYQLFAYGYIMYMDVGIPMRGRENMVLESGRWVYDVLNNPLVMLPMKGNQLFYRMSFGTFIPYFIPGEGYYEPVEPVEIEIETEQTEESEADKEAVEIAKISELEEIQEMTKGEFDPTEDLSEMEFELTQQYLEIINKLPQEVLENLKGFVSEDVVDVMKQDSKDKENATLTLAELKQLKSAIKVLVERDEYHFPTARVATPGDLKVFEGPFNFFVTFKDQIEDLNKKKRDEAYQPGEMELVFREQKDLDEWRTLDYDSRYTRYFDQIDEKYKKVIESDSYKQLENYFKDPYSIGELSEDQLKDLVATRDLLLTLSEMHQRLYESVFNSNGAFHQLKKINYDLQPYLYDKFYKEEREFRRKFAINGFATDYIKWLDQKGKAYVSAFSQIHLKNYHDDIFIKPIYTQEQESMEDEGYSESEVTFDGFWSLIDVLKNSMLKIEPKANMITYNVVLTSAESDFKVLPHEDLEVEELQEEDIFLPEDKYYLSPYTYFSVMMTLPKSLVDLPYFQEEIVLAQLNSEEYLREFKKWLDENPQYAYKATKIFNRENYKRNLNESYEESFVMSDERSFVETLERRMNLPSPYMGYPEEILQMIEYSFTKYSAGIKLTRGLKKELAREILNVEEFKERERNSKFVNGLDDASGEWYDDYFFNSDISRFYETYNSMDTIIETVEDNSSNMVRVLDQSTVDCDTRAMSSYIKIQTGDRLRTNLWDNDKVYQVKKFEFPEDVSDEQCRSYTDIQWID